MGASTRWSRHDCDGSQIRVYPEWKEIYAELKIKQLAEEEVQRYYKNAMLYFDKIQASAEKKEQVKLFSQDLMNRMK